MLPSRNPARRDRCHDLPLPQAIHESSGRAALDLRLEIVRWLGLDRHPGGPRCFKTLNPQYHQGGIARLSSSA